MNGPPSILMLVFVCFTVALSQQPAVKQQQTVKQPVQKVIASGKVDNFANLIKSAASLDQLEAAAMQANFSKSEFAQLRGQIEASTALKQKLAQLKTLYIKSQVPRIEQAKRETETRAQILDVQLSAEKRKSFEARIARIPARLAADYCPTDKPVITSVTSPITPGIEFAIEGKGF